MTDPPGATTEVFHINPKTGRPNICHDPESCKLGGADFHYPNRHDAEVAWKARQLERGIIAYRTVMQAHERVEEEHTLSSLAKHAKGGAKKISISLVRSLAVKNLSKYAVNFLGLLISYAIVSGKWLQDDWIRRLLPILAAVVLAGLVAWFVLKIYRGSRRTVSRVRTRQAVRRARP